MSSLQKVRIFNGNTLKIIAAISMLIDHLGLIFFPTVMWLRAIGRLAMPLFAFCLSEGCRYTRNKCKHFFLLFGLGAICQLAYAVFDSTTVYLGILLTFSLSVLLIYAMQYAKRVCFGEKEGVVKKCLAVVLFLLLLVSAYLACQIVTFDYGFVGVIAPVCASIFDFHRIPAPDKVKKLDKIYLRVLCMVFPLCTMILTMPMSEITVFSLLALPLLLLYNGERGRLRMKYFFYLFYPLHLVALEGIYILIYLF